MREEMASVVGERQRSSGAGESRTVVVVRALCDEPVLVDLHSEEVLTRWQAGDVDPLHTAQAQLMRSMGERCAGAE